MPTKETKPKGQKALPISNRSAQEIKVASTRAVKAVASEKEVAEKPAKKVASRYTEAVGRRKTSTARVRVTEASKDSIVINGKDVKTYFPTKELQDIVDAAISKSKIVGKYAVSVKVVGGGVHSQAEALRHGLSRALVMIDLETKKRLKKLGFLKRDPRMKERRKFGLKKARKAPQWSKR